MFFNYNPDDEYWKAINEVHMKEIRRASDPVEAVFPREIRFREEEEKKREELFNGIREFGLQKQLPDGSWEDLGRLLTFEEAISNTGQGVRAVRYSRYLVDGELVIMEIL